MKIRILILTLTALLTLGATSSAQATVKFSLWHSFVGADQRAPFMEQRMAQFRAKYPQYDIDEQKIPRDQYQTKLKTLAAAGELPEAFLLWPNAMTKEFAGANLLADINDMLVTNKAWKDTFVPRALEEFTVAGKTYGAGLGISVTSILFYNKALFDQNKVKVPTTWDELKTAIKAFSAKGIIPIALGNKAQWPVQSTIFSSLANRVTGSDWLLNALAGKGAKFTDPAFVDALGRLRELVELGAFNRDYNTIDEVQMRAYYYKGQAAMTIDGSWILADMIANAPADIKANTFLTVLPSIPGGKGDPTTMSGVSSTSIVTSAKATPEQKKAIADLIVFLTEGDAQLMYPQYNIPVSSKSVIIDPAKVDPLYTKLVDLIKAHPLTAVYDGSMNSEQADIVNNGLQAVMVGVLKPADLAKKLQATIK